jgi:hypothetical protein
MPPSGGPERTVASNRYYVCLWAAPGRGEPPVPFDPYAEQSLRDVSGAYWGRVFQAVERHLGGRGMTFYLTWDLYDLPSYGDDVVAISIGDEWGLTPRWAHRVRAAFKLHGAQPWLERNPLREPSRLATLALIRYVRSRAKRLPDDLRDLRVARRGETVPTRVEVPQLPVGYSNLLDLPIKPIAERPHAAFFAGSVENRSYDWRSPARWLGTPKQVARQDMLDALEHYRSQRPDVPLNVITTSDYWASMDADPGAYSRALMDAKICLAPRGTTVETYRVFEGLRYGCVVISDPLPRNWYYEGAPIVRLRRWQDLPAALDGLLADEGELEQRHQAALRFWDERCSEDAVGRFVARRVLDGSAPSSP